MSLEICQHTHTHALFWYYFHPWQRVMYLNPPRPAFSDHLAKQKYARQNFDGYSPNWEHVKVQNCKSKFKLIIYTIHILPDSMHYLHLQSESFHLYHQLQHWPNTDRWIITNWRLVRSVTCTREKSWICCCSSPQVTWRYEDEMGGGFKYFLFSPRSLGKWSHLTIILFRWVGSTTNLKQLRDYGNPTNGSFLFKIGWWFGCFGWGLWVGSAIKSPKMWSLSGIEFLSAGADGVVLHHHLDRSPSG